MFSWTDYARKILESTDKRIRRALRAAGINDRTIDLSYGRGQLDSSVVLPLHGPTHEAGGGDEIDLGSLAGELTNDQHGARAGDNLHEVVVAGGAAGFMTGADKTKLDGITAGAAVTSVALSAPAQFSVTGSPGTGAVSLALAWATQAANLVFAGPASGSPAAPALRALVVADLPVAASGVSSATQVVRADDSRLSDTRTPTTHTHAASDINSGTLDIARLPVAASGVSDSTKVVRSDDSRLSNARTPTAHTHAFSEVTGATAGRVAIVDASGQLSSDGGLTYDASTDTLAVAGGITADTDTFHINPTTNRVGVRTVSPTQAFEALGTIQSHGIGSQGALRMARSNGSEASPTGVLSGENAGQFVVLGRESGTTTLVAVADALITAAGDYVSTTNIPTDWKFRVGSTAGLAERMRLTSTGSGLFGRTSGLTGAGDWDVNARCRADTFETASGNKWKLLGWTTAADAASNGYVQVTIDGTTYKVMTRA